ncbi:hypothetical protein EUX98_g7232 [Antrodiella citrinella]|uniref:F-box domain-containing protein n=1 Tax=Antrodiella citrinella TaxID=2447956 RepID=A0A4S4MP06_9APHY|nr:hypothetical protein EUX98_g7232 [Antrodiella citrinella]
MSASNTGPRLPWDILSAISCSYFDSKTLLPYIRTCRTLYHSGIPHLLAAIPYRHRDLPTLNSFCNFVLDNERRPLFLREIHLGCPKADALSKDASPIYDLLVRVLELAKHINVLHILQADLLLRMAPCLKPVLSSFKKLTSIHLSDAHKRTQKVCATLFSPVTSASITYTDTFMASADLESDPTLLLQNFTDTLQNVSISAANVVDFDWPFQDILFPHVTSLSVRTAEYPCAWLFFMLAFPNVVSATFDDQEEPQDDDFDQFYTTRESKLFFANGCWSNGLDYLSAGIIAVYVAGIQTHVREWSCPGGLHKDNLGYFHTLAPVLQPSSIKLRITAEFLCENGADIFQNLQLTKLHLSVDLCEAHPCDTTAYVLDQLVSCFRRSMPLLKSLCLHLCHTHQWKSAGPTVASGSRSNVTPNAYDIYKPSRATEQLLKEEDHSVREYLDSMDMDAFMLHLSDAIPALEEIRIVMQHLYTDKVDRTCFSRVVQKEGEPADMRRVDGEDAKCSDVWFG